MSQLTLGPKASYTWWMELPIYQVDAFADEVFRGNPAAVCPLQDWLPDETLQSIAAENNLERARDVTQMYS